MLHILRRTLAISNEQRERGVLANPTDLAEIKLVQSRKDIEKPAIIVEAELIDLAK